MSVIVELPENIEVRLREFFPDLERQILEEFAVEAFRRGELSSGLVGEVLGMQSRMEAVEYLSLHKAYPGYDTEDFESDLRVLENVHGTQ